MEQEFNVGDLVKIRGEWEESRGKIYTITDKDSVINYEPSANPGSLIFKLSDNNWYAEFDLILVSSVKLREQIKKIVREEVQRYKKQANK